MTGAVTASGQLVDLCLSAGAGACLAVLFFATGIADYFFKSRPFRLIADFLSVIFSGALFWQGVQFSNDGDFKFYHIVGFAIGFIILNRLFMLVKRALFAKLDKLTAKRREVRRKKAALAAANKQTAAGQNGGGQKEQHAKERRSDVAEKDMTTTRKNEVFEKERYSNRRSVIETAPENAAFENEDESDIKLVLFIRKKKKKTEHKHFMAFGKKKKLKDGEHSQISENTEAIPDWNSSYVFIDNRKIKKTQSSVMHGKKS
ncbi:MAG: spore cortex biosynthesis protein YabQ [Clostridiaceae bacterium]|jgi:hypothetical protein|nr:spore cortex biosynthesis protein YabQ [Clostridiaceae bacterium]